MSEGQHPDGIGEGHCSCGTREQHQLRAKRVANEIMYRTGWPAPTAYELTSYLMLVIDEAPEGEV